MLIAAIKANAKHTQAHTQVLSHVGSMHSTMLHALAPPQLHAPCIGSTLAPAKLSAQRVIKLDLAGNKVWRVGEAEIQQVGGQEFICIKPNNQSLVGLIFQHYLDFPRGLKLAAGLKSLTCSDGLG